MDDVRSQKSVSGLITVLRSEHISPDDVQKLRPIFKECPALRSIPHYERTTVTLTQFCALMRLKDVHKGEVVIQDNNLAPDLYVVLLGGLTSSGSRTRVGSVYGQFQAVGELEALTGALWEPGKIIALVDSVLIHIAREPLISLMARIRSAMDTARMVEFLTEYVPGMRHFGHSSRERVANCFTRVKFRAKSRVVREGDMAEVAMVISAGQCLEVSGGDSLITVNRVNFGILTKGQWIGVESILGNEVMKQSIFAQSDVEAYEISKSDLLEKLGKDTLSLIKELVEKKAYWRESRKSVITETLTPFQSEKTHDFEGLPSGTPAVRHRIRQLQRLKDIRTGSAVPVRPDSVPRSPHYSFSANQSMDRLSDSLPTPAHSLNVSYWFSQFPKPPHPLPPRPTTQGPKHRLLFAATLGKTMVPSIGKKVRKVGRRGQGSTQVDGGTVREHFGYEREEREEGYSQKLNKRRGEGRGVHGRWDSL